MEKKIKRKELTNMRKKIVLLAFATVLGASLLVGCGDDGGKEKAADIIKEETEEISQEERTLKQTEETSEMKMKGEIDTNSES